MCESGGPNPLSHYQFDVLHKIVFFKVLRLIPVHVLRYGVVCCGHRVGVLWVVGVGAGQATHVVCCAESQITGCPKLLSDLYINLVTCILCVKWNMKDHCLPALLS